MSEADQACGVFLRSRQVSPDASFQIPFNPALFSFHFVFSISEYLGLLSVAPITYPISADRIQTRGLRQASRRRQAAKVLGRSETQCANTGQGSWLTSSPSPFLLGGPVTKVRRRRGFASARKQPDATARV